MAQLRLCLVGFTLSCACESLKMRIGQTAFSWAPRQRGTASDVSFPRGEFLDLLDLQIWINRSYFWTNHFWTKST